MTHQWDEFTKSLAEPLPRRESLRRLGAVFTAVVLSPLGLEAARGRPLDPCKSFCRCRNRSQQNACLAACKACNGDTIRLCGGCSSTVCCGAGQACCDGYCTDLDNDAYSCGNCGYACDWAGVNEVGVCLDGSCHYLCVGGATRCDGVCTPVLFDPSNCGACGHGCTAPTPYCNQGACSSCSPGTTDCGGYCAWLDHDLDNCGACGVFCGGGEECYGYECHPAVPPDGSCGA